MSLDADDRFILAGQAGFGAISGVNTTNIRRITVCIPVAAAACVAMPATRLGVGCGNEPFGGGRSSSLAWSFDVALLDSVGLVPFVDAGQVYDDEFPTLDDELLWAAGLGFRYYTPIGPIRVDVAFPLNGRSSDEAFRAYFSLGQAF